ncbi:MAG TPA: hypothetical protein EYN34_04735 [Aquifex sp.]|nr:hypothetical protein [Aquifex sp.]
MRTLFIPLLPALAGITFAHHGEHHYRHYNHCEGDCYYHHHPEPYRYGECQNGWHCRYTPPKGRGVGRGKVPPKGDYWESLTPKGW